MEEFNSIDEILDFAINAEQEAVDFYTNLSKQTKNQQMKLVFEQFAKEEIGHKAWLTKVKDVKLFDQNNEKIVDLKLSDYAVDIVATPNMTYQDALILAMKKEKAAYRLYSSLAEKTSSADLKKVFLNLAQEESKHKLRFEVEYDEYVLREN